MKRLLSAILSTLILLAMPITNVLATESYMQKVPSVIRGYEFEVDESPVLIIEKSNDHDGNDFNFELSLTNAKWLYEDTGPITSGITYHVVSEDTLLVKVDATIFNANTTDMNIPLYTQVLDYGSSYVNIINSGSYVTSAKIKFAEVQMDLFTVQTLQPSETISGETPLKGFKIYDNTIYTYQSSGTIRLPDGQYYNVSADGSKKQFVPFTVSLDNGFVFVDATATTAIDEAIGNAKFIVSPSSPSSAVIAVTMDTAKPLGFIQVEDLKIAPTKTSSTGHVTLSIYQVPSSSDDNSAPSKPVTVTLAYYDKPKPQNKALTIDSVRLFENKTIVEGTGHANKTIILKVDDKEVDRVEINSKGTYKFIYDAKLSDLDGSISVAYFNANNREESGEVTYIDTTVKSLVEIKYIKDKSIMYIDEKQVSIDAPMYIDSAQRAMIPVRSLAEALGISSDNITWDNNSKTTTIVNPDTNITLTITLGESHIMVDGKSQPMDTSATIQNSRIYIPLRSMANDFGIDNENIEIEWGDDIKSVTIKR